MIVETELTQLLQNKCIIPRYPTKEVTGLSRESGRELLNRTSFNKWNNDEIVASKPCNVNVLYLINVMAKDINVFHELFQELIQIYIPIAQVWKSKI